MTMPPIVDDLEALPEDDRPLYLPLGDGRHQLHPGLLEVREQHRAQLAALDAALDAKLRRRDEQHRRLLANGAVRDALDAAGVDPGLAGGAAALFIEQHPLALVGDDQVVLEDGGASVAFAVESWLQTPTGKPYQRRPRDGATDDGPFALALRQLRDRLH